MNSAKLMILAGVASAVMACAAEPEAVTSASTVKLPPKDKFKLVVLAGQSNMAGRGKIDPDNNKPGDTTVTEGPETGVYYFDAESGEYTIHLHSGNQFTLNDGVARVGTYTVSGETVSFTFTKESNGTATATLV